MIVSGCWDRREINEITFVAGMAIGKGDDKGYELTLEYINASQLNPQTSERMTPTLSFSLAGDTIAELDDKMNVGITRQLDFSHTRTVVIDEDLARDGVAAFLQYIERNAEFRNDFHLLVARGVKAKDIIKTLYPVQKVPSLKLDVQLQSMAEEWGGYPDVQFTDFTSNISADGRHAVAAAVTIQGDPKKGEDVKNNDKVSLDAMTVLDGLALFEKDKLIGYLSVDETRDYVWTQDLKKTTINAPCGPERKFSVRIYNSHTETKAKYEGDTPIITINLILEGELQSTQCPDETSKIKTYEKYEKELTAQVENQVKQTITKVQEKYGIDIFGFGQDMERQDYNRFKQVKDTWDEEFKKAKVDVKVKAFIRRDGIRNESFLKDVEGK